LDAARDRDDLVSQFASQAALGPLGVGRLVCVDTGQAVDADAVIAELAG
jgi:hypothetical protein